MDALVNEPPQDSLQPNTLYALSQFATWTVLALTFLEYVTGNGPPSFIASTGYFALLSAYVGYKETSKFHDPTPEANPPNRHGEFFVYVWAVFLLVAWTTATYVPTFHLGHWEITLHYPHELPAITIEVIGLFAGTKVSRHWRTPIAEAPQTDTPAGPAKPSPATATAHIYGGGLPYDGKWYASGEILANVQKLDPATDLWMVQQALNKLVKKGIVEKMAKGPHDPHSKYRWKAQR